MLRVHCDVLNIAHPQADKCEERTASLPHTLFPSIVAEHLCQFALCFHVFFLFLHHAIKVCFPVEHQTKCCFVSVATSSSSAAPLFAQAELRSSPLLYFWVIGASDGCEYFVSELGDAEVGIGAEELCKLALSLIGVGLKGLKSGVQQIDHECVVAHRDLFLSLKELGFASAQAIVDLILLIAHESER